jgi:hypothetical protein
MVEILFTSTRSQKFRRGRKEGSLFRVCKAIVSNSTLERHATKFAVSEGFF